MNFAKKIFYFFIIIILFSFSAQNVFAYSATSAATISLSDSIVNATDTPTVTFTFTEKPLNFSLNEVVATGGTLSNLAATADPLVYTATFTPNPSSVSSGDTVSITMKPTFVTYGSVVAGAWNLAYDNAGSMWVTNYFSNDVSKVTYDGTVTNYAGTGSGPRGIAFDGTNMWTANVTGGNVTKIAPDGSMTSYGSITTPMDIAYDGVNMWTVNNNGSISKITPGGVVTTYPGIGSNSTGIAFDGTNMWTVSFADRSVTKVAPDGSMTTYTGTGDHAFSIAFDGANIWTGNYGDNSVTKITPSGVMTTYPGLQSSGYDITFDGTNLWVASVIGVSKVTLDGQITNYTDISMYGASGIAVNTSNGSIWTANYNHSTVSKIGFASGSSAVYAVDTIAPVLTTGTAIPTATLSENAYHYFISNESCSPVATAPTSTLGAVTTHIDGPVTAGESVRSYLSGIQAGGTYSYGVACLDSFGNLSNSLSIGPYYVFVNTGGKSRYRIPMSDSDKPLDFVINNAENKTNNKLLSINLNASTTTTKGYIISLDGDFKNKVINPYKSKDIKFELPDKFGTYNISLIYVSDTGNNSPVITHAVSYESPKNVVSNKKIVKSKIVKKSIKPKLNKKSKVSR